MAFQGFHRENKYVAPVYCGDIGLFALDGKTSIKNNKSRRSQFIANINTEYI